MIDIHCHILPGIDDGPKNMEESLSMARKAIDSGVTTIVATPHLNRHYDNTRSVIIGKVEQLNGRLKEEKIPLLVLPGQEIAIYGDILDDIKRGIIQPLCGTQYVFIELPPNAIPMFTEKLIYDLQVNKIVPIIVHPERNTQIIKQPELLYRLVKHGALTQITAGSLLRGFGKETTKITEKLIEANLVHFIASDAHNVGSRGFNLGEAYDRIDKLFGIDYTYLFMENAELMVRGQVVQKLQPEHIERKKTFGFF